jgi:hypothetical protein
VNGIEESLGDSPCVSAGCWDAWLISGVCGAFGNYHWRECYGGGVTGVLWRISVLVSVDDALGNTNKFVRGVE